MPAEVESFASFREPAWHGLGTVFDHEVNTLEMLSLAGLAGWNVRLVPVTVPGIPSDRFVNAQFATVRDNPIDGNADVIGWVGGRYHVLQNEELFDFGDYLGSGARWETGGSLKGGSTVFGSLALERETVLDPSGVSDVVKTYILVSSSHDGTSAIVAAITPIRVVCNNTLNMALRATKQSFKIRHTATLEGKMAAARETLGLADRYMDAFDVEARALFETPVNAKVTEDIISAVYPEPAEDAAKSAKTRHANKIEAIEDILQSPTVAGIDGTAWGVFNALTQDLDFNRSARKGNEEPRLAAASGLDTIANNKRNAIFNTVKAVVGI